MDFAFSDKVQQLQARVSTFMEQHVYPNESRFYAEVDENRRKGNAWIPTRVVEEIKPIARQQGLWNLWQPKDHGGALTNLEYAPLCEIMGRVTWGPEVFNCSAPDTATWRCCCSTARPSSRSSGSRPLQQGEIRPAFLMTEPAVASSDATNIECSIERDGGEYVINGRKWWSSGVLDPRCKVYILMGKSNPEAPTHLAGLPLNLVVRACFRK